MVQAVSRRDGLRRKRMGEDVPRAWASPEGERLVTEALARGGLPEGAARFKLDDVEATLQILYLAQREWHGPKLPEARRREILKAVFDVEEPAT